jgi:flagellar basal body-associated protein FliL
MSDALTSLNAEHTRAKRKVMWRVIGIVLACILIAGAGVTWWVMSASQASGGVTQTLQTYCNALQAADWQQAYDQWSKTTQMSKTDFAYTQENKPKVTGCETGAISTTNSTALTTLTFFYADGSSAADQMNLVLEDGAWKIKSQSLS